MGLHDFTTKEVLNKVLLDSSGNAVDAFSHTSQEALNAALDSANSRLNVSLEGGTISGDVTISGDLTVSGDSAANISETITGDMTITSSSSNHPIFTLENSNNDDSPSFINFVKSNSGSAGDGDEIGQVVYKSYNDAGTPELTTYADYYVSTDDVSNGTEDGSMTFRTMKAGTLTSNLVLQSGNVGIGTASPVSKVGIVQDTVLGWQNADTTRVGLSGTSANALVISILGTTRMVIDANSRISLSNNDGNTSNTVFGKNAFTNAGTVLGDVGADSNIAIGEDAMGTGTTLAAHNNTAVGYKALEDITAGDGNVALGSWAGSSITTGLSNVAIGSNDGVTAGALQGGTTVQRCVVIGTGAGDGVMITNSGGSVPSYADGTVAVGYSALAALTSGSQNIAVGYEAMKAQTTGDSNVAVGYQSQLLANNSGADGNVSVGNFTLDGFGDVGVSLLTAIGHSALSGSLTTLAVGSTAVGANALNALTSGAGNTAVGYSALAEHTTGARNTAIGFGAMDGTAGDADDAPASTDNVFIGYDAGGGDWEDDEDSNFNVGIGNYVMDAAMDGALHNTGVGHLSSSALTTGDGNVAMGSYAMLSMLTGSSNVAIGGYDGTTEGALRTSTAASQCVAIGTGAAGSAVVTAVANGTVAVGYKSLYALTLGAENTAVGYTALSTNTIGQQNTAVGYEALLTNLHGDGNTAVGRQALRLCAAGDGAGFNTAIGQSSLTALTTGVHNVAIGAGTADELVDGSRNIAIGVSAMGDISGGTTSDGSDDNIFIGFESGGGTWHNTVSNNNVAIGNYTLDAIMTGALYNVAVGFTALSENTTGQSNVGVGGYAGAGNTTGDYNVAIGSGSASLLGALQTNTVGDYNIAIGTGALGTANDDSNDGTVAIGHAACKVQVGNGSSATFANATTAVGYKALTALTSGAGNTAVGYTAGTAITTALNNTALGYASLSTNIDGDNNTAIGTNSLFTFEANSDGEGGNVSVGASSGYWVSQGENNVFIGYRSGQGITGTRLTGNENTAVGRDAGYILQGAAAGNTLIGSTAGDAMTSGTNNTVLGSASDTDDATATNQTVIGYATTGVADNSVTLGNASVTAVYMAQDSGATVHCTGILNNFRAAVSVSTSATAIGVASQYGGLAMVWMNSGGNMAHDLVSFSLSAVDVVATQVVSGSAQARTYSAASGVLKVAMASGTYDVYATEIRVT